MEKIIICHYVTKEQADAFVAFHKIQQNRAINPGELNLKPLTPPNIDLTISPNQNAWNIEASSPRITDEDFRWMMNCLYSFLAGWQAAKDQVAIQSIAIEPAPAMEKCKCGNSPEPIHPCPYREEIRDDNTPHCNCCAACQKICSDDI